MKFTEIVVVLLLMAACVRGCSEKIDPNQALGRNIKDIRNNFMVGYNYDSNKG